MKIQEVINNIFRQNFHNPAVLGRVLFGLSILVLGLNSALRSESYVSFAPPYIPFPYFFAIFFGVLFTLSGLLILADSHIRKATAVLVGILLLFILVVYLPTGDLSSITRTIGVVGGAILVRSLHAHDEPAETPEEAKTAAK